MKLKCAIIDDDPVSVKVLSKHIQQDSNLELVVSYSDGESAINDIDNHKIDLIFLDVEMPKMSGLSFLSNREVHTPFIMISQKKQYSFDAFEFNSIDFLVKPISYDRFSVATEKVKKYVQAESHNHVKNDFKQKNIFVKVKRVWTKIDLSQVVFVKANNMFVTIQTNDNRYHVNISMKDLLKKLPEHNFKRIHRSYIVNINKIDQIDSEVAVVDQKTLPIGKSYLSDLILSLNLIK